MLTLIRLTITTWIIDCSVIFLCWYVFQHYYRKYKNYPPGKFTKIKLTNIYLTSFPKKKFKFLGPVPWPIIGNVLQVNNKHMYISFMQWSMEYGTKLLSVKLGLQNAVVINDPYRARELFGDFNFSGRPQCYFTQLLSGGCHGD